jgi:hypothetical protein
MSSGEKTTPEEVLELCLYVWNNELKGKNVPREQFLRNVKEALKELCGWVARPDVG